MRDEKVPDKKLTAVRDGGGGTKRVLTKYLWQIQGLPSLLLVICIVCQNNQEYWKHLHFTARQDLQSNLIDKVVTTVLLASGTVNLIFDNKVGTNFYWIFLSGRHYKDAGDLTMSWGVMWCDGMCDLWCDTIWPQTPVIQSRYQIWHPEIEYSQKVASHAQIWPQEAQKQMEIMNDFVDTLYSFLILPTIRVNYIFLHDIIKSVSQYCCPSLHSSYGHHLLVEYYKTNVLSVWHQLTSNISII